MKNKSKSSALKNSTRLAGGTRCLGNEIPDQKCKFLSDSPPAKSCQIEIEITYNFQNDFPKN